MNTVNIIGRLTKDLDVRYTGNGKAVVNFTMAVDRPFSRDKTDFINCVAWENTAENMGKYLSKGSQVGVTGYVTTRNYENNQGQRVFITEILADRVQFLDSKQDQRQKPKSKQQLQPKNENPFENVDFENDDPFESNEDVEDISDDDLPF